MIRVHDHWSWNLVVCCVCWFSLLLWLPIDPEIVFCLMFLVFSMALATHWSWNVGFLCCLGFLYVFGYPLILESWFLVFVLMIFSKVCWLPIDPFCLTCACWKCCFAIAKQRINLKTCTWPRTNICFQKWCFPTIRAICIRIICFVVWIVNQTILKTELWIYCIMISAPTNVK